VTDPKLLGELICNVITVLDNELYVPYRGTPLLGMRFQFTQSICVNTNYVSGYIFSKLGPALTPTLPRKWARVWL
jgi:hypothetical protein